MQSTSPILKHVKRFIVTGLSTRTQNSDEFNEETARLPNLWQQFYSSALAVNGNTYGIYSDYESDANGLYTVTVGVASDGQHTGFASVTIQTGNYLVFQSVGQMPFAVVKTWQRIWDYFKTKDEYQRSFISDFELYSGSEEVAIYIGIK